MHGKIETCAADIAHGARMHTEPAPSLRIPVTPRNRGLLRHLRAIEMAAWENYVAPHARGSSARRQIPTPQEPNL